MQFGASFVDPALHGDGVAGREAFRGFAQMLSALDFYLEKPKEIVLVGEKKEQATRDLLSRIHSLYLPNKTLRLVSPDESLKAVSPLLEGKTQINGRPTIYICQNFTCSPPVTEWEELKGLLEDEELAKGGADITR